MKLAQQSSRSSGGIFALGLVVVAGVGYLVYRNQQQNGGGQPGTVTVPDVVGLSQSEATVVLTAFDLVVGAVTTQASSEPSGIVIGQTPDVGAQLPAGSPVNLLVSTGPAPNLVGVPFVVGSPQSQAEQNIQLAGLTVGEVTTQNSSTVAAGNVISQSPVGGTEVTEGSPVDLVVSIGVALVPVPDIVGLPAEDAAQALFEVGLIGNAFTEFHVSVPAGYVIRQIPEAGTMVDPGSSVDVYISVGPRPVTVPNLVGLTLDDAITTIDLNDLVVGNVTNEYSDTVQEGRVISQSPEWQSEVVAETEIDLVVSLGRETVMVPDVKGLTQTGAEIVLQSARLVLGEVLTNSSRTVPAGLIITQAPAADTLAFVGTGVSITISTGPDTSGTVQSLALTPASFLNLEAGESAQLLVTATFVGGGTGDVTDTVGWTISVPSVCTVNSEGMLLALDAGVSQVTASLEGVTSNILEVTVTGSGGGNPPPDPAGNFDQVLNLSSSAGELLGQIHAFTFAAGKLWAVPHVNASRTNPGVLIRWNSPHANLSDYDMLHFDNDGRHNGAAQIVFDQFHNSIWICFSTSQGLPITEIDANTLTIKRDIFIPGVNTSIFPGMALVGTSLYIVDRGTPSVVHEFNTGTGEHVTSLSMYPGSVGHQAYFDGAYLWVGGQANATTSDAWIARLTLPLGSRVDYVPLFGVETVSDDIVTLGPFLWLPTEDNTGRIILINKSTLEPFALDTGVTETFFGCHTDGINLYVSVDSRPGTILVIDGITFESLSFVSFPPGSDGANEVVFDNGEIFATTWPGQVLVGKVAI